MSPQALKLPYTMHCSPEGFVTDVSQRNPSLVDPPATWSPTAPAGLDIDFLLTEDAFGPSENTPRCGPLVALPSPGLDTRALEGGRVDNNGASRDLQVPPQATHLVPGQPEDDNTHTTTHPSGIAVGISTLEPTGLQLSLLGGHEVGVVSVPDDRLSMYFRESNTLGALPELAIGDDISPAVLHETNSRAPACVAPQEIE